MRFASQFHVCLLVIWLHANGFRRSERGNEIKSSKSGTASINRSHSPSPPPVVLRVSARPAARPAVLPAHPVESAGAPHGRAGSRPSVRRSSSSKSRPHVGNKNQSTASVSGSSSFTCELVSDDAVGVRSRTAFPCCCNAKAKRKCHNRMKVWEVWSCEKGECTSLNEIALKVLNEDYGVKTFYTDVVYLDTQRFRQEEKELRRTNPGQVFRYHFQRDEFKSCSFNQFSDKLLADRQPQGEHDSGQKKMKL
eukprot:TRINITY_DN14393_c0_g5_i1.p1 TRINITY_DN14393_c0_g5~~TRINITY_DN14393_c0_g5_i1.p1  ORF type:complete len:266 (+),score=7.39 TRINITY_DN14393_c0_g5_i1:47-799(+)